MLPARLGLSALSLGGWFPPTPPHKVTGEIHKPLPSPVLDLNHVWRNYGENILVLICKYPKISR